MDLRTVGNSGLQASVVGLGCNNFGRRLDKAGAGRVVDAAIEAGITLFDTADVYGNGQSEEYLGAAIKGRRDELIIATKFSSAMGDSPYMRGGSRRYIVRAVEASLSRLGTEYVDLYQIHGPDRTTPIDETLSALDDLVRSGKVRYIGCSNYSGWQIADADWTSHLNHCARFISAQNHYSLLERGVEKEVLPACARFGLGLIPYFPLASGMLTGKYRRGEDPPEGTRLAGQASQSRFLNDASFGIVEALQVFAAERGTRILDVAIGALLARPQVCSVIAGATKPDQVEANVAAAAWVPTADDLERIEQITS